MDQAAAMPARVRCRHCGAFASQLPPDWYQHQGDPEALLCDVCFKDILHVCRREAVATYRFWEKRLIAVCLQGPGQAGQGVG
jgi:hypothetical protein